MIQDTLAKISLVTVMTMSAQLSSPGSTEVLKQHILSSHEISLENRYEVKSVSDVFRDNILLNMAYMRGSVTSKDFNWDEVKKPFKYEFKLDPEKTFAFHDEALDEYKGKVSKTTNAHFNAEEGFKTDGYLFGDGVCHLASLLYWVAKDAGLDAKAPTGHDFMVIPEIAKENGVSIYSNPQSIGSNAQQNLYITNNKGKPITFKFEYNEDKLKVSVFSATCTLGSFPEFFLKDNSSCSDP